MWCAGVEARCHLQVDLGHPELADELAVLDARGREVVISQCSAGARSDRPRHPLQVGRSAVLSVPESGVTLVLFREGAEVDRSTIQLDPTRTVQVQR